MSGETAPPVWLAEEIEIQALLNAALDRFDRLPAEQRGRDLFLPAESFLKALSRSDETADQLWALVGGLERQGVLRIRRGRVGPYDPAWKGAKLAFSPASEPTLRGWLQRDRALPELVRWRAAVQAAAHVFPGGCEALSVRRVIIEGRDVEEVVAAFVRMAAVTEPVTLRQLSALCFWGDSKVLDERGDLVAALFPGLPIRERAIVVSVRLPPQQWQGVLFIENQDTYTAACGGFPAETADLALVYASGFRSSAQRIRNAEGAILHYARPGVMGHAAPAGEHRLQTASLEQQFEDWWFDRRPCVGPCWFWGDLDFAGMQILKSLRDRFGEVSAWQPGYAPMLAALSGTGGYSPASNFGRGQIDPGATGCPYADTVLLPAIREQGQLDQELPIANSSPHG